MGKQVRFLDNAGASLIDATVPKARKPKFELVFKIIDLNNVPLVSGTSYVKWHLPHSAAAEHRGKTHKAPIKDHKVVWDYERTLHLRVIADKDGMLQDTEMHLEVTQEYNAGPRSERISLGHVKVNLAEYIDASYDSDEGVLRRYLMQESKINSTLKLAIAMTQTEGDKTFTAPTLKAAPLFSGIAGIMSVEQAEQEDSQYPASGYKFSRDTGEMQDLYRRTLTASYSADGQDLPADECIEDIFGGGDGWGRKANKVTFQVHHNTRDADSDDGSISPTKLQVPKFSRTTSKVKKEVVGGAPAERRKSDVKAKTATVQASEQQASSSGSDEYKTLHHLSKHDVPEFDLREDLRSWHISAA